MLSGVYLGLFQALEGSESQTKIKQFIERNLNQSTNIVIKKKKKKTNYNNSKVLLVFGDTLLIRDFILNEVKTLFNMVVQLISGTRRRNATNFKLHIVEGSQSHAAYNNSKENLLFPTENCL